MKTRKIKLTLIFTILMSLIIGLITFLSMNITSSTNINFNNQNKEINYSLSKKNPRSVTITNSSFTQSGPTQLKHVFTLTVTDGYEVRGIENILEYRIPGNIWLPYRNGTLAPNLREIIYDIPSDIELNTEFRAKLRVSYYTNDEQPSDIESSYTDVVVFKSIPQIQDVAIEKYYISDALKLRLKVTLSQAIDNNTTLSYKVASRDIDSTTVPSFGSANDFAPGSVDIIYDGAQINKEYKFEISGKHNNVDLTTKIESNWIKIRDFTPIVFTTVLERDPVSKKYTITVAFNNIMEGDVNLKNFSIILNDVTTSTPKEVTRDDNPTANPDKKTYVFNTNLTGEFGLKYQGQAVFKYGDINYIQTTQVLTNPLGPIKETASLEYITNSNENLPDTNNIKLKYKFSRIADLSKFELHLHKADGTYNNQPDVNDDSKWSPAKEIVSINPLPGEGEEKEHEFNDGSLERSKWYMVKINVYIASYEPVSFRSNQIFVGKEVPAAQTELTTRNGNLVVGPFSFTAKLKDIVDPSQAITSVDYKLLVSDSADGSDPRDTGITATGNDRSNDFEAAIEINTNPNPIVPEKHYSVEATIKYDLGDFVEKTVDSKPQSGWVKIDDKTPPSIPNPLIATQNGNISNGPLSFEVKLDKVVTNRAITSITYNLWVSDNADGSGAIDTEITANSDVRDSNYKAILESNDKHTINTKKWYSVKAIVNYDVGNGEQSLEPVGSTFVKIVVKKTPNLALIISLSTLIPLALIYLLIGVGLGINDAKARGINRISDLWREIE